MEASRGYGGKKEAGAHVVFCTNDCKPLGAASAFFMFSAEDVDASLFADEPEGRGGGDDDDSNQEEDDLLDDLIDGFCRESLKPSVNPVAPSLQLAQYDNTSAGESANSKRRRLNAGGSNASKTNTTLTAFWSTSQESNDLSNNTVTQNSDTTEYSPPLRLPNVGSAQITESQRAELFPEVEDLRAIARWIIEDDHIAVCCACLEDLWTEEDAEPVSGELLQRFASFLKEEEKPEGHQIALISSCHHMFHKQCIDKWSETENACCQCKQRFGLMAIYTEEGKRLEVKAVKKRLQSHTIREEQLSESAGHICYVCRMVGDRESLMQCALCDVFGHWYCHQYDSMPSEPWYCVDHLPRPTRPSAGAADHSTTGEPRRVSRVRSQARAPGRNRQTSRVTGNFPITITTRRGRGSTAGNAVLREAINSMNQPEPSAAALADTWLPAHTLTDAFDVPFDPAATSYAEFHRPREREQQRITKSSINDLLMGQVPFDELMGKPTQERNETSPERPAIVPPDRMSSPGAHAVGLRMQGIDMVSRSNPVAEAAHEQNQQLLKRAEEHENRAKQHREKEAEHKARGTFYEKRRHSSNLDGDSRQEAAVKAREHFLKAQEYESRATEHEERARLLRLSATSAVGIHRTRRAPDSSTAPARPPPTRPPPASDQQATRPTERRSEQAPRPADAPARAPASITSRSNQQPPKTSLEAALAGLQKFVSRKGM